VEPAGRTVLCAEIPCARGDALWSASDADLADAVIAGLGRAGLPVQCPVLESAVRRLPAAYPVYRRGFEACFDAIDGWLAKRDGLLSFGRQGLYAHDNTHHALFMAQAAVACLGDDGRFDRARWADFRRVFDTHVVED
jgi:protoporphyrinogen oxidase